MKPKEKKPETVFRIISKVTGEPVGSYSRAYCDEFDFESVESARNANCHGEFKDKGLYKIAKYRVTYELIEDDVDRDMDSRIENDEKYSRFIDPNEGKYIRISSDR